MQKIKSYLKALTPSVRKPAVIWSVFVEKIKKIITPKANAFEARQFKVIPKGICYDILLYDKNKFEISSTFKSL